MFNSLAQFSSKDKLEFNKIQPHQFAHCIIDIQRGFCDPDFSDRGDGISIRLSEHIAKIAPLFRAASIPTYIIYYGPKELEEAEGGLFKITLEKGDIPVKKNDDSAFDGSNIDKLFKKAAVKTLLISGVNISYCVQSTVLDGLKKGYDIHINGGLCWQ